MEENKLRLKEACFGQENIILEQILVLGVIRIQPSYEISKQPVLQGSLASGEGYMASSATSEKSCNARR